MKQCNEIVCSVCIANYNGIRYIDACIKSILRQDCNFFVEIIIHDDASTDNSIDFIKKNYPNVRLIESEKNVGFCKSNNRMAKVAQGEFLLLLNNDAELFPNALSTLCREAVKVAKPVILGVPQYNAATKNLIDRGMLFDPFLYPIQNLDIQRKDVGMVTGACLWIPKLMWNEIGGFPEWFHSIAEDMYICLIARLKGYKVVCLQNSGFYHWVGSNLGGGKIFQNRLKTNSIRRALSERNRMSIMIMTYPFPFFQIFFPIHLGIFLAEGIFISLMKKDLHFLFRIYLFSVFSIKEKFNKIMLARSHIQKNRNTKLISCLKIFKITLYKLTMLTRYGFPYIQK